jgi:hypothetical protein
MGSPRLAYTSQDLSLRQVGEGRYQNKSGATASLEEGTTSCELSYKPLPFEQLTVLKEGRETSRSLCLSQVPLHTAGIAPLNRQQPLEVGVSIPTGSERVGNVPSTTQ